MSKQGVSPNNGFEVAAELLWRAEIVINCCGICKDKRKCYSPFLTYKTGTQIAKGINKIRQCDIRRESFERELNEGI